MGGIFGSSFASLFNPFFSLIGMLFKLVIGGGFSVVFIFLAFFFVRYRLNPFRLTPASLRASDIKVKYYDLFRWLLIDFLERGEHVGEFREYGFTFFVGQQGAGKTISMVRYLDNMKRRFPKCLIVTNFSYDKADFRMVDWRDILNIRNGTDGVIFAIDEIHSEYSSASWKDIPESLLSEISQQRKQRIKIVATAQFYSRIAKPLRQQASSVIVCSTLFGRFTRTKEYSAQLYETVIDNPNIVKKKMRPIRKSSFVQSDSLRSSYDTYEKIDRMKKIKFIPRGERGD